MRSLLYRSSIYCIKIRGLYLVFHLHFQVLLIQALLSNFNIFSILYCGAFIISESLFIIIILIINNTIIIITLIITTAKFSNLIGYQLS